MNEVGLGTRRVRFPAVFAYLRARFVVLQRLTERLQQSGHCQLCSGQVHAVPPPKLLDAVYSARDPGLKFGRRGIYPTLFRSVCPTVTADCREGLHRFTGFRGRVAGAHDRVPGQDDRVSELRGRLVRRRQVQHEVVAFAGDLHGFDGGPDPIGTNVGDPAGVWISAVDRPWSIANDHSL